MRLLDTSRMPRAPLHPPTKQQANSAQGFRMQTLPLHSIKQRTLQYSTEVHTREATRRAEKCLRI